MRIAGLFLALVSLAAACGSGPAQEKEKEKKLYLVRHPSGTKAGMISVPTFSRAADSLVGLVNNGSKVEMLEVANDTGVPAIKWYKVKVLDGDMAGSVGYISATNLKELPAAPPAGGDGRAGGAAKKEPDPDYAMLEARLLIKEPDFRRATERALHVGMAPAGTLLKALDAQPRRDAVGLLWRRVAVLSGDMKGKEGWVSEDAIAKAFLIAGRRDANLIGRRGEAVNRQGKFAPTGDDTRSADAVAANGPLTDADYKWQRQVFEEFFRGRGVESHLPLIGSLVGKPGAGDAEVIQPVLKQFLDGGGAAGSLGLREHKDDEPLSRRVKESGNYKFLSLKLTTELKTRLQKEAAKGRIDLRELDLDDFLAPAPMMINYPEADVACGFLLKTILGGTQGLTVVAKRPTATVTKAAAGGGSVVLKFRLAIDVFDVFGVNNSDLRVLSPGLAAMWHLQHRGPARPFIHVVHTETDFEERLNIPAEYREVVNWLDEPASSGQSGSGPPPGGK